MAKDKAEKTYAMAMRCGNCGHKGHHEYLRGSVAKDVECPHCGCREWRPISAYNPHWQVERMVATLENRQ